MLPKKHRFTLRAVGYSRVPVKERYQGPFFNLVVYERPMDKGHHLESRFAFVISSRVAKKAVLRNRTKRLLSEAVRQLLPQIRPGFTVAIFAKQSLLGESFNDIRLEMGKLLQGAKLLQS